MNSPKRLLARRQVENQFDRAALTYDRAAELQRQMGNKLLELIREQSSACDSLIDLGCGTGETLSQLQKAGFQNLTGLDLSSRMIEIAKSKATKAKFIHAGIEDVPSNDGDFQTVISNAAIQWCDLQTAAKEIHRILNPNGQLFLTAFVEGTLSQWQDAFLTNGFESRVHQLPSQSEITSAFANAGFEIHAAKQAVDTNSFESVDLMFASIKQLGATNAMQSRSKMSRHEYRILRNHFDAILESEGKLDLDFVWVCVAATKMARQ